MPKKIFFTRKYKYAFKNFMKKSIAFLLASLAASSSILFHRSEAFNAIDGCKNGNDNIVLQEIGGKRFRIYKYTQTKKGPANLEYFDRRIGSAGLGLDKKIALKAFKEICRSGKSKTLNKINKDFKKKLEKKIKKEN